MGHPLIRIHGFEWRRLVGNLQHAQSLQGHFRYDGEEIADARTDPANANAGGIYHTMTRDEFHNEIDRQLDELGQGEELDYRWGELSIRLIFEKGRIVLKIRERETEKVLKQL